MATMTDRYIPTWEKRFDPWDLEPEIWDKLQEEEESENAKVADEISIEEIEDESSETQFDEEFDL